MLGEQPGSSLNGSSGQNVNDIPWPTTGVFRALQAPSVSESLGASDRVSPQQNRACHGVSVGCLQGPLGPKQIFSPRCLGVPPKASRQFLDTLATLLETFCGQSRPKRAKALGDNPQTLCHNPSNDFMRKGSEGPALRRCQVPLGFQNQNTRSTSTFHRVLEILVQPAMNISFGWEGCRGMHVEFVEP